MGLGSVTGEKSAHQQSAEAPGSWNLAPQLAGHFLASDVQGIVVSGFAALPVATALFLLCEKRGGAWLNALREKITITAASGPQQPAAMIAFTATGLSQLGLPKAVLSTFPLPFWEGMLQKDRRHRLGDDIPDALTPPDLHVPPGPGDPVPVWSGNAHKELDGEQGTPLTVHALLVLYDESKDALNKHLDTIEEVLTAQDVKVVRTLSLDLQFDANGLPREHFGFADGISQPIPFGPGVIAKDGSDYPRDPVHGVPLGELLLGYENAHGEIPPGPLVAEQLGYPTTNSSKNWNERKSGKSDNDLLQPWSGITMRTKAPVLKKLRRIRKSAILRDLGFNGTYLVVRELRQDVAKFWTSLDREAKALNELTGASPPVDAEWLAERIVGRTKDGALLCPGGQVAAAKGGQPENQSLFFRSDRRGLSCPLGSHVRRSNPRDGLAKDGASRAGLLRSVNHHRILRRGRKFGPRVEDPRKPENPGEERGILFMCINTDIERQFEFVQQNWVLNPHFATLFNEVDPLVGRQGPMTLPEEPMRRMINVDTYVTLTGGDYFFLPSIGALDYFGELEPSSDEKGDGKP